MRALDGGHTTFILQTWTPDKHLVQQDLQFLVSHFLCLSPPRKMARTFTSWLTPAFCLQSPVTLVSRHGTRPAAPEPSPPPSSVLQTSLRPDIVWEKWDPSYFLGKSNVGFHPLQTRKITNTQHPDETLLDLRQTPFHFIILSQPFVTHCGFKLTVCFLVVTVHTLLILLNSIVFIEHVPLSSYCYSSWEINTLKLLHLFKWDFDALKTIAWFLYIMNKEPHDRRT